MRLSTLHLLPSTLLLTLTTAFQLPNFQPFFSAFTVSISDFIPPTTNNETSSPHDLLKRQYSNTCPTDYHDCSNIGGPGLCCPSADVCSADFAGNIACCPTGVACSGTIGGVITAGTVNSYGSLVGASGSVTPVPGSSSLTYASGPATTTTAGLVPASAPSTVGVPSGSATATGGTGIFYDGSTVATPGAAVRGAQVVSLSLDHVFRFTLMPSCSH